MARARPLCRPLPCLLWFSGVVVLTHLPGFYDATLRHPLLHDAEHLAYLLAGAAMWWPILGGDPLPSERLSGLGMLVYLLFAMPAMALVGAYLDRAPQLVYSAYAAPARALGVSALRDQAQAGAIMWVGGDLVVVVVGLWAILAAMLAEERHLSSREARLPAAGGPA
jgi:putative copper resistance protein D